MASTQWVQLLNAGTYSQLNAGTIYNSSNSATDVSPGAATNGLAYFLPSDFLNAGMQLRITANGIVGNTGTPTLNLGVYYGGVLGTALATTGAVATASSLSNSPWELTALIRVETVGPSGTVRTIGKVSGPYAGVTFLPATASGGNSVAIAMQTASALTIGATWGTNASANTLTVYQYLIESVQY